MRVLIINTVCGIGSTGKIVTDIASILMDQQHQPLIAYGYGKAHSIDESLTYRVHSAADYYIHNFQARITDHTGLYSKKATKKLIRKIESFSPDLIHLHNIHGYYINYEILFSYIKESGIPVIWTLHDCWPFTGHCTHFMLAGCYQWKSRCYNCAQLRRYPKCYFNGDVTENHLKKRNAFSGVQNLTLVTPSVWLSEMVKSSFLGDYHVEVIPNGVDLDVFKPDDAPISKDRMDSDKIIILGASSHWNEAKGLNDFIRLSESLDDNYQLVLLGLTAKQIRQIPSSIIALPRTTSSQEMAAYYNAADLFLNLSYEETMGMTTVEAMACGTPVIVYDKTALPETVTNGCGEIVETGDLKAIVSAIDMLSGQKPYRKEQLLSQASKFEKHRQYEKYVDLYHNVLN